MTRQAYIEQVKLLLQVLPEFSPHQSFALKGGTAINLFIRNLSRLSVDLDFAYTPIADRKSSLDDINNVSYAVSDAFQKKVPNTHVHMRKTKDGFIYQILVQQNLATIKIDINHIIRGTVFPPRILELCHQAQQEFNLVFKSNILSFEDLYAGKLCAALDRQHPRDFFDVKCLLDSEGISQNLIDAFVVYLISHNRPMHELLKPNFHPFEEAFNKEFSGMAFDEVSYDDLVHESQQMLKEITSKLTNNHREFLISFKRLAPKWELLNQSHIANLPAVKWKMLNLKKLSDEKRENQLALLEKVLSR